jgi:hypothetical protein
MSKERIDARQMLVVTALLIAFIEVVSAVALKFLLDSGSPEASYLVVFLIAFPSGLALLSFLTLWFRCESLPGERAERESREDVSGLGRQET